MAVAGAPGRDRTASIQRVFFGLLAANLVVVGVKATIGIRAGSLSVISDAIHSSVDALNNMVFVVLMRYAGAEADANHPYGHGKFEVLGALSIVIFLAIASFELLKSALARLVSQAPPPVLTGIDLGLLAGTLVVNLWVAWLEARKGHEFSSDLLLADAAHTRVDVMITTGVIAGSVLSRAGIRHVDPIVTLVVVLMIGRVAYQILRRGVPVLVDQAAQAPEAVRRSAEGVEGVRSAYDIRSRLAAGVALAELTIRVSGRLSVDDAHDIADAVEHQLKDDLKLDRVVVHIEPA
ncbi:MAG TPA: cation diffusion facilitator family transporter [Gemmatimonadales bacterium]|nr:cation diffusion facilitator family transporter [Gemmatimonadales bacterium]